MKPLTLTIAGLNSFEETQTIDFETLTADGLFGIFGPTGSGKSSIIDAMTLALYGEMPRFRKEKRKEWINLNCAEMSVRYTFQLCGDTYTAERRFKRAEDNKSQSDFARLYALRAAGAELLAERPASVNKEILRLVGLNYEDFTRSVLLPQGRFSEFLLLENKERRLMLERLFHLEAYGETFNERVRKEAASVRERLAVVENSVAYYEKDGEMTAEALTAARQRLSENREALAAVQTELEKERIHNGELLAVQADVHRYEETRAREAWLMQREADIAAVETRLQRAEQAAKVVPYARACTDTTGKLTETSRSLAVVKEQLGTLQTDGGKLLLAYEEAVRRKRDELPLRLRDAAAYTQALRVIDSMKEAETERAALLAAYQEQQARQRDTQSAMAQAEAAERQAEEMLQGITKRRAVAAVDPAYRRLVETGAAETQRLEECRRRMSTCAAERDTARQASSEAVSAAEAARVLFTAAENALQPVRAEADNARFRHDFAAVAAALITGEPCPLCGATAHPAPAPPISEDEWLQLHTRLDALTHAYSAAERAAREAETAAQLAEARHAQAVRVYGEAEDSYNRQHTLWAACARDAGTEDFAARRSQIEQNDVLRVSLEKQETEGRTAVTEARARKDAAARVLTEAAGALGAIRQQGQERKMQIEKYKTETYTLLNLTQAESGLPSATELRAYAQSLHTAAEQEAERLHRAEENAATAYRQAEEARQEAERRREALLEARETLHRLKTEQEASLQRVLSDGGFNSAEASADCLLTDTEREAMVREAGEYRTQRAITQRDLHKLSGKLSGTDTENIDVRVAENTEKIRSLEVETDRIKEQITLGQERLAAMESGYAAVKLLKRERADLTGQYDLLYDLTDLLRGNAFVEYMATGHLTYITADASQRLKRMTAGRYALELLGADFVMRDDFNGGARRSPKTLSGGETFMAALCLALALSANIQLKNNALLEFFFLDEGFGTLDAAALDTVMTALEQLPREQLTVGVITHVDEMKQRIPRRLLVTPPSPGEHGSRVSIN